jgi:hypothetical protein
LYVLQLLRLYLWETVVTPRGFSSVAMLWRVQCFTLISGWLIVIKVFATPNRELVFMSHLNPSSKGHWNHGAVKISIVAYKLHKRQGSCSQALHLKGEDTRTNRGKLWCPNHHNLLGMWGYVDNLQHKTNQTQFRTAYRKQYSTVSLIQASYSYSCMYSHFCTWLTTTDKTFYVPLQTVACYITCISTC